MYHMRTTCRHARRCRKLPFSMYENSPIVQPQNCAEPWGKFFAPTTSKMTGFCQKRALAKANRLESLYKNSKRPQSSLRGPGGTTERWTDRPTDPQTNKKGFRKHAEWFRSMLSPCQKKSHSHDMQNKAVQKISKTSSSHRQLRPRNLSGGLRGLQTESECVVFTQKARPKGTFLVGSEACKPQVKTSDVVLCGLQPKTIPWETKVVAELRAPRPWPAMVQTVQQRETALQEGEATTRAEVLVASAQQAFNEVSLRVTSACEKCTSH